MNYAVLFVSAKSGEDHAMDWYPTLASLAGIKIPEGIILDGRDLSAYFIGKTDSVPAFNSSVSLNAEVPLLRDFDPGVEFQDTVSRDEYLNAFFYHGSAGSLSAVRSGDYKLFLNPNLQLYNLEDDPGESVLVQDGKLNWKLRGMAVLFQKEMRDSQ